MQGHNLRRPLSFCASHRSRGFASLQTDVGLCPLHEELPCRSRSLTLTRQPPADLQRPGESLSRRDSALDFNRSSKSVRKLLSQTSSHLQSHHGGPAASPQSQPVSPPTSPVESKKAGKHNKSVVFLKKLVSLPCKRLFARSGAEVHDSSGLDSAVALYLYAAANT